MDPVEAGDWIAGRPLQLVFLTGLDPANKPQHNTLVNTFRNRTGDKPPLQLRVISGELDLPNKEENKSSKGILRREWPQKYLERIPALIVLFIDLEWDHPSWEEKKTEAESKIASIRASLRHGTKIALVMIQDRTTPTSSDDNLAAERAHELCQSCSITSKQLFIIPIHGDIMGYVNKLETAFHDLASSFYQQKFKTIRSRNIPNNSPALVVRQMFKLAFISELRQDTNGALRNYRLAYDQCKDSLEHWEGIDTFEWRSVTGLLNYKICQLCFSQKSKNSRSNVQPFDGGRERPENPADEAINQMRRHQTVFFSSSPGVYPTPQLASIELLLWKAKQCWHFAQLFDQAVTSGLTALSTFNPGTHLNQAATIYSAANTEIATLKRNTPITTPYPSPDPLETSTVFFGQRPWRVCCEGLATADIEEVAVNAIIQRLVVNHEGVISLLTASMAQFKKYGCVRMQKKVMCEMANVCYSNSEITKSLQLWSLVVRDAALPFSVRKDIMHRATWASYAVANVKEFAACCMQLMSPTYSTTLPSQCEKAFWELLSARIPSVPFSDEGLTPQQLTSYHQQWKNVMSERQFFNIQASRIQNFIDVQVSFLEKKVVEVNTKVPVRVEITSAIRAPLILNDVIIICKAKGISADGKAIETNFDPIHVGSIEISSEKSVKRIVTFELKNGQQNQIVTIGQVLLELGDKNSHVYGQLEFDEDILNPVVPKSNVIGVKFFSIGGVKSGVKLKTPVKVDCLIGEVATAELLLENMSINDVKNLKLDFKRNEQKFTEAAAVLFVDKVGTELNSEFSIDVCHVLQSRNEISISVMFSAQLVGVYDLQLELSYEFMENDQLRHEKSNILVSVVAKEPFTVTSGVLNMNGIPMTSILNHCEHILNVSICSSDTIIISSVEFLLADVVTLCDTSNGGAGHNLEDVVSKDEMISYSAAIRISAIEEDAETPLGRLAVEWKKALPNKCAVRTVFALCRVPVLPCPISINAHFKSNPATVRQPIDICFSFTSHSKETIELSVNFDVNDVFMFCGERKNTMTILPDGTRRMNVIVMALSAGRLIFPRISLKSPQIADNVLQQALRSLPATIFVLPKSKELLSN